MAFQEAKHYLDALGIDAMKSMPPSLHRMEAICDALNHPERLVPAIHITGTNGKTSTARIASALLAGTGLRVGTYTSPHLETMRERISLNGEPVSEEEFGDVFDHLRPYADVVEGRLGEKLTFFEVMTAMFFLWAAESVDAAVVEVGLGGRWDATNVVEAPVAVVTNVGLDHTDLLGHEREVIAKEKVGIIKHDAFVVSAERAPSVRDIIVVEADAMMASVSLLDRDFRVRDNKLALGGRYLSIDASTGSYDGLFLPLQGAYQGINAATALEAVTRFLPAQPFSHDVVAEGFANAAVPGRMEQVGGVVLDVAHNPDGMSAFVSALAEAFAFSQAVFVVGILAEKDYASMIAEMARLPCRLIATAPKTVRAVDPPLLKSVAEDLAVDCEIEHGVVDAVRRALRSAGDALVCVTGSHYVVGEARAYLRSL